jgi:hypothetical protein
VISASTETLRIWVRRDEANDGSRADRLTTAEREELVTLRRENLRPAPIKRDTESGERVFCPRTRPAPSEVSAFVDANRERLGVEPVCLRA